VRVLAASVVKVRAPARREILFEREQVLLRKQERMQAGPLSIKKVFGQEKRFVVPLFQRPYVWEQAKQWEPLWEDLRALAERLVVRESPHPHFLGAIVLDQMNQPTGQMEMRLVIDGQQRLTTLQIFLEAFCDLSAELNAEKHHRALVKLTRNDDPMSDDEDEEFKVWPTNVDQDHFRRVMRCQNPDALKREYAVSKSGSTGHPIADAYLYFYGVISEWLSDEPTRAERLDSLFNAIRDFVRLVVIDLESDDDAQLIFETLNARGTPLLPSDLVKNFLFHRLGHKQAKIGALYKKYWQHFDEDASYWREELGRGHASRHRIDTFLQHLLTVLTGSEVTVSHLYMIFRDYAVRGPEPEAILQLLGEYASVYRSFDHFPPSSREGVFFNRVNTMDMTSAYPLLLEAFKRYRDEREVLYAVLRDLESFLVRRMVCQLNTRGYNRLFLDLLKAIQTAPEDPVSAVRACLLSSKADSSRWPDDEEFRSAWLSVPMYMSLAKGRVRMLLEAIEMEMRTRMSEEVELKGKLSVEHLMPQNWKPNWPLPESVDPATAVSLRDAAVQSIGNLTLVTERLNPALSNRSWEVKKPAIQKHSLLRLNAELNKPDFAEWDEKAILARGEDLFFHATNIWPFASASA
jgi:uncharacterized protein with ParB-like and HNH nuclease domain